MRDGSGKRKPKRSASGAAIMLASSCSRAGPSVPRRRRNISIAARSSASSRTSSGRSASSRGCGGGQTRDERRGARPLRDDHHRPGHEIAEPLEAAARAPSTPTPTAYPVGSASAARSTLRSAAGAEADGAPRRRHHAEPRGHLPRAPPRRRLPHHEVDPLRREQDDQDEADAELRAPSPSRRSRRRPRRSRRGPGAQRIAAVP